MRRLLRISLCGLLLGSWSAAAAQQPAAETNDPSDAGQPRVVRLKQCPIMLMNDVQLAAERPGILDFVEPNEGDMVRAGRTIARLKDGVARAVVEVARIEAQDDIDIRYAREANAVDFAEYQSALATNRRNPNTIPSIEIQKMELIAKRSSLQIEKAQHDLEIKRHELQRALEELKTYQVEAPFDGFVTKIYKSQGEAVQHGEVILEMVNTRTVKVEGFVDIRDAPYITPGALVQIQLTIPKVDLEVEKRVFEGRVRFIDVRVNELKGNMRIWAEVLNQDNLLKDGMRANMDIFCTQPFAREASSRDSNPFEPVGKARSTDGRAP